MSPNLISTLLKYGNNLITYIFLAQHIGKVVNLIHYFVVNHGQSIYE